MTRNLGRIQRLPDSRPLWPGHKPAQLYVVIQEPKTQHRGVFVSYVWFTTANDKTHAVKLFNELCPQATPCPDKHYKKPTAQLVLQGGDAIRV